MYRLRFYNVKKNEYGVLYFSDSVTKKELRSEFQQRYGQNFIIRNCEYHKIIKNFAI